jgi:hypothetical protein
VSLQTALDEAAPDSADTARRHTKRLGDAVVAPGRPLGPSLTSRRTRARVCAQAEIFHRPMNSRKTWRSGELRVTR